MAVIAISLFFASFFTYLVQILDEANDILHNLVKLPFHLSAVIVSIVVFIWLLVRVAEVQTRRDSFSYYKYLYYGFAWSLPLSFIFLLFQNGDILKSSISLVVIWSAIITSLYLLRFIVIDKEKSFLFTRNHSPEVVDEKYDKYGFSKTAESIAGMINSLAGPVSVIKLRGDLGTGKSTMVSFIENKLNHESTLITHISLTETNEEADLSKLFTERWFDTLASRYLMISQKINQVGLNSLKSILRDSGNGIIGSIVSALEVFDFPLLPTKGTNKEFISTENAKLFNYIPEIREDLWLIVIDEIERAPYREILRLIEIVERFKIKVEGGLPIKICFLMVVADEELRYRLNEQYEGHDGDIINTFFFKDPKNITHQLWLPPKNYTNSSKHFLDKATKLANEFKLELGLSDEEKKSISMYYSYIPSRDAIDTIQFEPSHKEAMSFINYIMLSETPRVINRTIEQCKIFLNAYVTQYEKEHGYDLSRSRIPRYADLLILSYAAIRYSWLIDFFNKTIDDLQPKDNVDYSYLKWSSLRREKGNDKLKKIIKEVTGHEILDSELKFLSGVFKFAANCYTELVGRNDDKHNNDALLLSTSYALNLNEFLSSVVGGLSTNTEIKSFETLELHKRGQFNLSMSNVDLLNYSRFLNKLNLDKEMELLSLEVAEEIVKRTQNDEFNHIESNDAFYISEPDVAAYQFVFLLTKLLAYKSKIDEEIKNKCLDLFISILSDSKVQTHLKYLILSSFVNSERGSGGIHAEMLEAFEVLKSNNESKIEKIIKSVYSEFRNRYIELKQDIYVKEDNPYHVMYQSWSGDIKDEVGIEELRGIATRYLYKHPEVIRKLWEKYPSRKNFEDLREYELDRIADDVYLTLDDLIKSTEASEVNDEFSDQINFWKNKRNDLESKFALKAPTERHDTTLRMVLKAYWGDVK